MPLELASFPRDLNPANPTFADPAEDGYQHLNLVKGVLRGTFPKIAAQITATDVHLNNPLLATERPATPVQLGEKQKQSIPYYTSETTASTTEVTDFSKLVLACADAASLGKLLGTDGFASTTGTTFTGPVTAPEFRITGTNIKLSAAGIQLGNGCVIGLSADGQIINISFGGAVVCTINAAALKHAAEIQGFGL